MDHLRTLLSYRQLVSTLVTQELRVKYRRSALGFLWSIMNPLIMLVVIATVFHFVVRLGIQSYALFLLSSLLPWMYFATATNSCALSLLRAEPYLRHQPLPKLVFPLSTCLFQLVNFGLSLTLLLALVGPAIGLQPHRGLLVLPLSMLCLFATTLGIGAAVATLTVYFRDFEHLIGVALMAWMYATPILYPLTAPGFDPIIPTAYHWIFELNPMYPVIQLFTMPIYWGVTPNAQVVGPAIAVSAVALIGGTSLLWWREDELVLRL